VVLCNYQPACSFTARSHSNTRAAAELRAAAQQTAPSTLNPTAALPRRTPILVCPRPKARLSCLTTRLRPHILARHGIRPPHWYIQSP